MPSPGPDRKSSACGFAAGTLAAPYHTRATIFAGSNSGEPAFGVATVTASTMKVDHCNALITGASAGIGREFARQLADRARSIVLVARRGDRLAHLREELLNRNPSLDVHVRAVDLADKAKIGSLIESLAR